MRRVRGRVGRPAHGVQCRVPGADIEPAQQAIESIVPSWSGCFLLPCTFAPTPAPPGRPPLPNLAHLWHNRLVNAGCRDRQPCYSPDWHREAGRESADYHA